MSMLFGGAAGMAVDAFATPVTLRRYEGTGWASNGTYDPDGAIETRRIMAAVQAPSRTDLQRLPEGERTEGLVAIWTREPLRTGSEESGQRADEIISDGLTYRVVTVMRRREAAFTRALARLTHDRGRSL